MHTKWSALGLCVSVCIGAGVMWLAGALAGRFAVHLLAGVFGLVLYLLLARVRRTLPAAVLATLGVALVASSLWGTSIEGVARWHSLGVLRVHPSALLTPALLVYAAAIYSSKRLRSTAVLGALQLVHLLQPDAGQATAVGLSGAVLALAGERRKPDLALSLAFAVSSLVVWLRLDPLPPAPFVEDIVHRAVELGAGGALAAAIALALAVCAPYLASQGEACRGRQERARAMLSVYMAGTLLAACFGEFPIALLGFGSSPVIGAFLGLAALERMHRAPSPTRSTTGNSRATSPRSNDSDLRRYVAEARALRAPS